jgi:predicted HD phosphohydrolase
MQRAQAAAEVSGSEHLPQPVELAPREAQPHRLYAAAL